MKRILKVIALGICLGALLVAVRQILDIEEAAFWKGYWIAAAVILGGALLINVGYNLYYIHAIKKATMLLNAGRGQEYIARMEALLEKAKGKNLRKILKLDLAAGYIENKQFEAAIRMLEDLSFTRLQGSAVEVVYRINLCLSYFQTGRYEQALAVYHDNPTLLQKYKDDKTYGGHIAILDVIAAMIQKQYDQAETMLTAAQARYPDRRLQKAMLELAGVLEEMKQHDD